jgi:hypothetical protein
VVEVHRDTCAGGTKNRQDCAGLSKPTANRIEGPTDIAQVNLGDLDRVGVDDEHHVLWIRTELMLKHIRQTADTLRMKSLF